MTTGTRRALLIATGAAALVGGIVAVAKVLSPRTGTTRPTPAARTEAASVAPATPWRTIPADTVLERIGFGSCLDQKQPMPIWTAVLAAKPQLFLMLGDNVYGDVSDDSMTELRTAYRRLLDDPAFTKARGELPFQAIWDDHDFGRNDAGGAFPLKAQAAALFREFWQVTGPRAARSGLYDAVVYGPPGKRVQIIMLDTRYFRSEWSPKAAGLDVRGPYGPDTDAAKTMLGPEQWAWLEAELARPAELRLVVSSIQLLADGHGFERWGNFPAERERFMALLRKTRAKGVLVLSGDRHFGSLHRRTDGVPYPLIDITSSALNVPLPDRFGIEERDPQQFAEPFRPANFGMERIDWAAKVVRLELVGLDGVAARHVDVRFADVGIE